MKIWLSGELYIPGTPKRVVLAKSLLTQELKPKDFLDRVSLNEKFGYHFAEVRYPKSIWEEVIYPHIQGEGYEFKRLHMTVEVFLHPGLSVGTASTLLVEDGQVKPMNMGISTQ